MATVFSMGDCSYVTGAWRWKHRQSSYLPFRVPGVSSLSVILPGFLSRSTAPHLAPFPVCCFFTRCSVFALSAFLEAGNSFSGQVWFYYDEYIPAAPPCLVQGQCPQFPGCIWFTMPGSEVPDERQPSSESLWLPSFSKTSSLFSLGCSLLAVLPGACSSPSLVPSAVALCGNT